MNLPDSEREPGVNEFHEFLDQLLQFEELEEGSAQLGIVKLAHNNGTEVLSSKQRQVLEGVVNNYIGMECSVCGEKIPIEEVVFARNMQEGYCNYHWHQSQKDN